MWLLLCFGVGWFYRSTSCTFRFTWWVRHQASLTAPCTRWWSKLLLEGFTSYHSRSPLFLRRVPLFCGLLLILLLCICAVQCSSTTIKDLLEFLSCFWHFKFDRKLLFLGHLICVITRSVPCQGLVTTSSRHNTHVCCDKVVATEFKYLVPAHQDTCLVSGFVA